MLELICSFACFNITSILAVTNYRNGDMKYAFGLTFCSGINFAVTAVHFAKVLGIIAITVL